MLMINRHAARPLYLQLADILRERIASGALSGRVPSARQLAQEHDVAELTARHALRVLAAEGVVESVQGRGTFTVER